MKTLFIFSLLVISLMACKKSQDVTPQDAADKIAGTYTVYQVSVNADSRNYPYTENGVTVSAIIVAKKLAPTTISVAVTERLTNQADKTHQSVTYTIRDKDLYVDNTKVGTADGTNFNISPNDSGIRVIILSKR